MTSSRFFEKGIVIVFIIGYIMLSTGFSLGPIFEGPDEIEHYRYIRTLAKNKALPDPTGQPWGEYHQAPLYYMLAAPLSLVAADTDFGAIDGRRNPHYGYQFERPGNDNKNLYLHSRNERFPYSGSGTALVVHFLRLFSVMLGTCTLLVCYLILRLLWPRHISYRIAGIGFVAFWPQFVYMSSVITNDGLLFLLSTLSLYLILRQYREGPSWKAASLTGLVVGAALLTKASAIVLAIPLGIAVIIDRRLWRYALLSLVIALAISGWWYARNWILYDDPTGVKAMYQTWQTAAISPGDIAWDVGLERVEFAYRTFWARFSQGAVAVPGIIYRFFDGFTLFILTGLAITAARIVRGKESLSRAHLVACLFALVWIPAVVYYSSTTLAGNQGRFLMPGVAGWGVLVALGFNAWFPERFRLPLALANTALLATIAVICLVGYFYPAYRLLPGPETIEQPLSITYGDAATLIGMAPADLELRPGEMVRFALYWQALNPTPAEYTVYLHSAFAPQLIWRDSYPGNGNLLSSEWKPGQTWAEVYVIEVPDSLPPGASYPLVAGLYDPARGQEIPARDEAGNSLGNAPIIGTLTIHGGDN